MNKSSKNFASKPETSNSLESDSDVIDNLLNLFVDDMSESDKSDADINAKKVELSEVESNSRNSEY
ncbi:MAG: hypothetical protein ACRC80_05785, partial [Waterburya sp.]